MRRADHSKGVAGRRGTTTAPTPPCGRCVECLEGARRAGERTAPAGLWHGGSKAWQCLAKARQKPGHCATSKCQGYSTNALRQCVWHCSEGDGKAAPRSCTTNSRQRQRLQCAGPCEVLEKASPRAAASCRAVFPHTTRFRLSRRWRGRHRLDFLGHSFRLRPSCWRCAGWAGSISRQWCCCNRATDGPADAAVILRTTLLLRGGRLSTQPAGNDTTAPSHHARIRAETPGQK